MMDRIGCSKTGVVGGGGGMCLPAKLPGWLAAWLPGQRDKGHTSISSHLIASRICICICVCMYMYLIARAHTFFHIHFTCHFSPFTCNPISSLRFSASSVSPPLPPPSAGTSSWRSTTRTRWTRRSTRVSEGGGEGGREGGRE
jgi:hypothetical protein